MSSPRADHPTIQSAEAPFLSVYQEIILAKAYDLQPYPTKKERRRLATEIHASEDQVKLWYRKRRVSAKNQLNHDRQRAAKLAYLNSLAEKLVRGAQQPSLAGQTSYRPVPYYRPRVIRPSLYSRVRPSPYIVPSYAVSPYYYQ